MGNPSAETAAGCRRRADHGGVRGHDGERQNLAQRRGRQIRDGDWPRAPHVRGLRSGSVRLVHQELRTAINLFVDHSQIVQLECLRSGIWGTKSTWGRILTYQG